jgi:hypothetical protein
VTFESGSLVRPADRFNAWVTCNSCGFALWAFAGEMEAAEWGNLRHLVGKLMKAPCLVFNSYQFLWFLDISG